MFSQDYMSQKSFADSIRESPSPYNEAGRRGFWEPAPTPPQPQGGQLKESGDPVTVQNKPNQHLICSGVQDYALGKQTEVGPWRAHKSLSEYHGEEAFGSLLGY